MRNIHLIIIVALDIAAKYYSSIPEGKSRSLMLLLLSLLVCDIESIIEGKSIQSVRFMKRDRINFVIC